MRSEYYVYVIYGEICISVVLFNLAYDRVYNLYFVVEGS